MLGCCGINCSTCGAYLATQADDDTKRKEVADQWTVQYKTAFLPEQINCDGCTADGRLVGFAESICGIRKCCVGKGLSTCAECTDFPCAELQQFFRSVPAAKVNLESLRG